MGLFSIFKKGSAPAYSCYRYKVTGINPASGRKKNVFVIAASNAAPEAVASKSGLLAPYNVELAQEAPTARQLELVKKKRIALPPDASMLDASIFIQWAIDGVSPAEPAPLRVVDYAIAHNVFLPKYAGIKEARDYLIAALPDRKEEIKNL